MSKFVHLHVHSHYSLLDGLPKINDLVSTAKRRGFSALALTDHGNMYGAIEFYKACLKEKIKPIIGSEVYMAPCSRFDKDKNKKYYHLVLLAENYTGYRNLMKLVSIGHLEGFYYKPRIDKEVLQKYSEGLIATSACMAGEVARNLIREDNYDKAKQTALQYQEIMGKGNFFLEMMDLPALSGQTELNNQLIKISKDTGIPLVVTRDLHYLDLADDEAQDILTCIRDGRTIDEPNRLSSMGVDFSMATGEEIASRFKHVPEALENTVKIAERVNLELELNKWHFPAIELPEGKNENQYLRDMVFQKLPKLMDITDKVKERANYELGIISKKGYSPYFVAVADFVNYARENRIVETTRGSGAGSLVSYALGITTVNPLEFKLPFERFLNPFRPSPPDIDTDFADDRRDDMIAYVSNKYGEDKVAQIITFGTMMARGSVRDVGRALGYSYSFCDQVAKLIPFGAQGFQMTIAKALDLEPELKKLYKENEQVKRLLDLAQKIEGCARHTSIHAAGVVVSPTPLTDFTPVQHETGGEKITTQYEMHSVEAAGVLKFDFLGIRNLSILGNAVEIVEKTTGDRIDIYDLPFDDQKTYQMLARGETMGVFQLSGSGMTRYLKELRPTSIFDIMAMVALFRPGPMESIPEYIRRKQNPELVTYLDDRMEDYLDQSLGLIVYQDDVLLTAINLAGYNWEEADKFRKAMGKKIPAEMEKQKIKFFQGCRDHGKLPEEKIKILWELIEPFAAYGFNKCLAGETEILNPDTGEINRIEDLFNKQKSFCVSSLGENKKFKSRKVTKIYNNGRKKVYKLTTRSGRCITATSNHPFLKFDGWVNLSDLKTGSLIAVPRKIDYMPSRTLPKFKLATLGYLIAEGNLCHPHGVYFYSSNKDEISDFIKLAKQFNNTSCTVNHSKSAISVYVGKKDQKEENSLMQWIRELGLHGKKAIDKELPNIVFQLSKEQLAVLVGKMWQGDGSVQDDKHGQIHYATSSKKLSYQMQHLLLRFGIVSTIHTKKFKYRGVIKIGYSVRVSRYNNIALFAKYIGLNLIGKKRDLLEAVVRRNNILNNTISAISPRGTKDIVPVDILPIVRQVMKKKDISVKQIVKETGLAERLFYLDKRRKGYLRETVKKVGEYLRSYKILDYACSDIYWDEVVSVDYKGIEQTYDLTVPGEHNYIASNLIVHNSHAASYGVVAYQTAYMKANYPIQYMTAALIAESGDSDKVPQIIYECERMGVKVKPPDVNESFKNFAMITPEDGQMAHIRFGLNAIKNVGGHIADVIYRQRKENGRYNGLEDFLQRIQDKDLNKKSLESLIKCGAMDSFGMDRGVLLYNIENILNFIRQLNDQRNSQQDSLFAGTAIDMQNQVRLDSAELATEDQKLLWEKELLGLYVTSHPFKYFQNAMEGKIIPLKDLDSQARKTWVVVAGVIDSAKKKITRSGKPMMFVTIQDTTDNLELLVFPRTYEITKEVWEEGKIACVIGKTSEEEGDDKLFVEKAFQLDKDNLAGLMQQIGMGQQATHVLQDNNNREHGLEIVLSKQQIRHVGDEMKEIMRAYPGQVQIYLKVEGKKIKTSFKVEVSDDLIRKLKDLVEEENIIQHH
ncbi:MAG: DNA polymerase III subunit alpha [bacterium]